MVTVDRRKDKATAMAISAALRQEAEYGYEITTRQVAGSPVPAKLAEYLVKVGVDRRSAADVDQTESGDPQLRSDDSVRLEPL